MYKRQIGGLFDDRGLAVDVDILGNVVIGGYFEDTIDFNSSGSNGELIAAVGKDVFVAMYDNNGNFKWVKGIGGGGTEQCQNLVLDDAGNTYFTGVYQGTADLDPSSGVANVTTAGGTDLFLIKLDVNGNYIWSGSMGGFSYDYVPGLDLDSLGNVYMLSLIHI